VKEAKARNKSAGYSQVKIVTFDWFEDSLQARRKKTVKGQYDMPTAAKEKARKQKKRKMQRDIRVGAEMTNFAKIVSDAKATYNLQGYHCYVDPTGFTYDVELLRNVDTGNGVIFSKVVLRLFESDEPPYYYACYSTYIDMNGREAREVHANPASQFTVAFEKFKEAFEYRTKVIWEQRWFARSGSTAKSYTAFTYKQPELGPLGMDLPPGRQQMQEMLQEYRNAIEPYAHDDVDDDDEAEFDTYRQQAGRVARANTIHEAGLDEYQHIDEVVRAEFDANVVVPSRTGASMVSALAVHPESQATRANVAPGPTFDSGPSDFGLLDNHALRYCKSLMRMPTSMVLSQPALLPTLSRGL